MDWKRLLTRNNAVAKPRAPIDLRPILADVLRRKPRPAPGTFVEQPYHLTEDDAPSAIRARPLE